MTTIESYFDDSYKGGGLVNLLSPVRQLEELEKLAHEILDNSLELTITFIPALHEQWREETLKEILEKVLTRVAKRHKVRIILIGEHSEIGRFHYHGLLYGAAGDAVAKIKRSCQRNIGRTEIKVITYTESYFTYMFKSYHTGHYPNIEKWGTHSYIIMGEIIPIHVPEGGKAKSGGEFAIGAKASERSSQPRSAPRRAKRQNY